MNVDIEEFLRLENELKASCGSETSPVILDAKMNILKYLQVQTVVQFQLAYDDSYYELNKEGGLERLRSIAAARSTGIVQPKVLAHRSAMKAGNLKTSYSSILRTLSLQSRIWTSS
ncbi:unnamed protein product [Ectocarpus sp. 13 AM-2016]